MAHVICMEDAHATGCMAVPPFVKASRQRLALRGPVLGGLNIGFWNFHDAYFWNGALMAKWIREME